MIVSPIFRVYSNLQKFTHYRGIATDHKWETNQEKFSADIETRNHYVEIKGMRGDVSVGIYVVSENSKYLEEPAMLTRFIAMTLASPSQEIIVILGIKTKAQQLRKIYDTVRGKKARYELYEFKKFYYVVPEHVLVPRHSRASEEDIKWLLYIARINPNDLPKIKARDAASIWHGFLPGEIIRQDRASEASTVATTFLLVV